MKVKIMLLILGFWAISATFVYAQEGSERFAIRFNPEKTQFTIRNPDNESYELILSVRYRESGLNYTNGFYNGTMWHQTNTTQVKIRLEPKSIFTSDSPEWRKVFSSWYFDNYVEITIIDWV
jgi:hypothetical protein